MQVLDGIRVIDFSTGLAGPHCTKMLADYGADVIKVEPSTGDETRSRPPFVGDLPGADRSLMFLHLNRNKRSVTINPAEEEGRAILRRLICTAQVVVEDFEPGVLSELGLGYADLAAAQPELVYTSITPWGQDGPYVDLDFRASDLILQGMGGPVQMTGSIEREPLKLAGPLGDLQAGVVAAYGTVLAVMRAETSGAGDHVDVSIYETQMGSRDRRTTTLTGYAYMGVPSTRTPGAGIFVGGGVQSCSDGEIDITAPGPKINDFVRMIGREDLVGDERLMLPPPAVDPAFVEEISTAYLAWAITKTKREALAEAQSFGLLSGAVNTPADLVSDPHYRDRGVWEAVEHPVAGTFDYPGRMLVMSETPKEPSRPAPQLGEHNLEVLTELLDIPADQLPVLRGTGAI